MRAEDSEDDKDYQNMDAYPIQARVQMHPAGKQRRSTSLELPRLKRSGIAADDSHEMSTVGDATPAIPSAPLLRRGVRASS